MAEENDFQMTPVTSSQIAAVGFNAATNQLRIRFLKNGSLYEYDGVSQEVYDNLLSAQSVGTTFGQTVKGVYPYKRLE